MILGGISPLEILSTYSAATFSGPMTASRVSLTPVAISLNSKLILSALALVASLPPTAAVTRFLTSVRSVLIIFFMVPKIRLPKMIATRMPAINRAIIIYEAELAIWVLSLSISSPSLTLRSRIFSSTFCILPDAVLASPWRIAAASFSLLWFIRTTILSRLAS